MRTKANSIKLGMTRLNMTNLGFEWIDALNKELQIFGIFTEVSLSNDADEDDVVVAVLSTTYGEEKIEMRWRVADDKVFRVVEYTHDEPRRVYYKIGDLLGWKEDFRTLDKELLMQSDIAFYFTPEGYIAPIKYRDRLEDLLPIARRRDEIQPVSKDKTAHELARLGRGGSN